MHAILGDIHGNLEALTAVLGEIERQGILAIYNLGDTVGYGPNPVECLGLASQMTLEVKGDWDEFVLHDHESLDGLPGPARKSVLWSQTQLDSKIWPRTGHGWRDHLSNLPQCHREGDVLFVHGSPRNPLYEYVFPEDAHNSRKMERIGNQFVRICFCGHSHVPGIFLERGVGDWEFIPPQDFAQGFPVAGSKLICNVGSVGQPRDGDPRACYALFDGKRIWLRRVQYDVETTIRKIREMPDLDDFLGDRLGDGR